jgi:hypothetical protein
VSLQELKAEVEELSTEQQFELAAYLQHLREQQDANYHDKLTAANERLAAGKGVSLDELRKR